MPPACSLRKMRVLFSKNMMLVELLIPAKTCDWCGLFHQDLLETNLASRKGYAGNQGYICAFPFQFSLNFAHVSPLVLRGWPFTVMRYSLRRGASSNRIFRRKEGLKGRHPKMWPNPTVGKPTMSCEKGRRKIRIHKKNGKNYCTLRRSIKNQEEKRQKLLHVTSKENELVK